MQLRYVIAQIVPDLIRQEQINIGVLLQSDQWVNCKFIQKIPKDWEIPEDVTQDVVRNINPVWQERLQYKSETLYIPEIKRHKEVSHLDRIFLDWLHDSYDKQLRFSDVRGAEVEIEDAFGFDTFLERLYSIFVAPKPRLHKPPARSKLHSKLKNQFKQLKLFGDVLIQERRHVEGTFQWVVDFWYKYQVNGDQKEVAIDLADFGQKTYLERVMDIYGIWNDLKFWRKDVERISVVDTFAGQDDHKKALDILTRSSDSVYILDLQGNDFFTRVQKQLEPALLSGQIFTREQFFNDLGKISRNPK